MAEQESGPGSTLAGVSSDFEDSLLRRVARAPTRKLPDPGAPAIGSVLDGKYQLESLIGRGGMGFVFAARHLTTGPSGGDQMDVAQGRPGSAEEALRPRGSRRGSHPSSRT